MHYTCSDGCVVVRLCRLIRHCVSMFQHVELKLPEIRKQTINEVAHGSEIFKDDHLMQVRFYANLFL